MAVKMYKFGFLSLPQIVVQVLQALLAISCNISNNCQIERESKITYTTAWKGEKFSLWCDLPPGPTHPHTLFISS